MDTKNWNPELYLKYKKERTQPSIDLVNRIEISNPNKIVDIGCGPGNSTEILIKRWQNADIIGIDNSPQMIEKAKKDYPDYKWLLSDAKDWKPKDKYDIIFSNATLQWMSNQKELIKNLFDFLSEDGILAVQVPANSDSPLHKALIEVSKRADYDLNTKKCRELIHYHNEEFYYDILSQLSSDFNIWTTTYYHILNDYIDLIEWYKGSGMKIYLDSLPEEKIKQNFEKSVLEECKKCYKQQKDGKIIFGFRRLFFTVKK
ncbi:MAG TPA: methyltransferase domain-containing protein [Spirochaetota bacterium]|nr:methyltransferase domain-containing protein [Spirochaetota bacterium]